MSRDYTVVMPDGQRLRIASARRYVVAVWIPGLSKWRIEYRTDKESNALAQWRHECRITEAAHVIDRETREVIR